MRNSKGKTIEEIVGKLSPKQKELAVKLRSIISKTIPDVVIKVKWGNIVYSLNGKDIVWLLFYETHVDLGFFRGAELDSKLFEGTGKDLRHIKIKDERNMPESEIRKLLKTAAELEKDAN